MDFSSVYNYLSEIKLENDEIKLKSKKVDELCIQMSIRVQELHNEYISTLQEEEVSRSQRIVGNYYEAADGTSIVANVSGRIREDDDQEEQKMVTTRIDYDPTYTTTISTGNSNYRPPPKSGTANDGNNDSIHHPAIQHHFSSLLEPQETEIVSANEDDCKHERKSKSSDDDKELLAFLYNQQEYIKNNDVQRYFQFLQSKHQIHSMKQLKRIMNQKKGRNHILVPVKKPKRNLFCSNIIKYSIIVVSKNTKEKTRKGLEVVDYDNGRYEEVMDDTTNTTSSKRTPIPNKKENVMKWDPRILIGDDESGYFRAINVVNMYISSKGFSESEARDFIMKEYQEYFNGSKSIQVPYYNHKSNSRNGMKSMDQNCLIWDANAYCGDDDNGYLPAYVRVEWIMDLNKISEEKAKEHVMMQYPNNFRGGGASEVRAGVSTISVPFDDHDDVKLVPIWNPDVICGNDRVGYIPAWERARLLVEKFHLPEYTAKRQIMEDYPHFFDHKQVEATLTYQQQQPQSSQGGTKDQQQRLWDEIQKENERQRQKEEAAQCQKVAEQRKKRELKEQRLLREKRKREEAERRKKAEEEQDRKQKEEDERIRREAKERKRLQAERVEAKRKEEEAHMKSAEGGETEKKQSDAYSNSFEYNGNEEQKKVGDTIGIVNEFELIKIQRMEQKKARVNQKVRQVSSPSHVPTTTDTIAGYLYPSSKTGGIDRVNGTSVFTLLEDKSTVGIGRGLIKNYHLLTLRKGEFDKVQKALNEVKHTIDDLVNEIAKHKMEMNEAIYTHQMREKHMQKTMYKCDNRLNSFTSKYKVPWKKIYEKFLKEGPPSKKDKENMQEMERALEEKYNAGIEKKKIPSLIEEEKQTFQSKESEVKMKIMVQEKFLGQVEASLDEADNSLDLVKKEILKLWGKEHLLESMKVAERQFQYFQNAWKQQYVHYDELVRKDEKAEREAAERRKAAFKRGARESKATKQRDEKREGQAKLNLKKFRLWSGLVNGDWRRVHEILSNSTTAEEVFKRINFGVKGRKDEVEKFKRNQLNAEAATIEVKKLLAFDIDKIRDYNDRSILMLAVQQSDEDTIRLCAEVGANFDERNSFGLTALFFAQYFNLEKMISLLKSLNATDIGDQNHWKYFMDEEPPVLHPIDWDTQLRIAEKSMVPVDTQVLSAEDLDTDGEWRMERLSEEEKGERNFEFFDNNLLNPLDAEFNRVVLLEESVHHWFLQANQDERQEFKKFINRLKPEDIRRGSSTSVKCHRRSIVGHRKPFEVLCAYIKENEVNDSRDLVALFSPYVESEIDGKCKVGVLIWAITTDSKASLTKALIEEAEFKRNKVDYPDDRYPALKSFVLEIGKDMHLIDLKTTSIFTGGPMSLLMVNLDDGDLRKLMDDSFKPKKRLIHHEQSLHNTLFQSSEEEEKAQQGLLAEAVDRKCTNLFGGAGTGKTMLLMRKIISEDETKKLLFVSRLSRLVSAVKTRVETDRDGKNVTFTTYDDLMTQLVRCLSRTQNTTNIDERTQFSIFSQVTFSGTADSISPSFEIEFYSNYLNDGERMTLKKNQIESMTLWGAFRVIKSNIKCAESKRHLTVNEYVDLPQSFGLNENQRKLVYKIYLRYEEWLREGNFKWDEADRVMYILMSAGHVFNDKDFISWEERSYHRGEEGFVDQDNVPLAPFYYHTTFIDEAQDFSDLDLFLLFRMSSGVRSVLLGADPAQSIEIGLRMQPRTVNDVVHACLPQTHKAIQVKDMMHDIQMKTNHRTHAQNLQISKAIRKMLARSFGIRMSEEHALLNGPIPEALKLDKVEDLINEDLFRGGNIVFITPDEKANELRFRLLQLGIQNDVFSVRDAKGLEFPSVALVGFFAYFEELGNTREWQNSIRWLYSEKGLTKTESAESFEGHILTNCDYVLSHPEIEDQAMMLYTALTRPREHLYFLEFNSRNNNSMKSLADFAFRNFKKLELVKVVHAIDEGEVDMTPEQHKARGVLLVTQAINMSRDNRASIESIKEKFTAAARHFKVDQGNDKDLFDQCNKHLEVIIMKHELSCTIKSRFYDERLGISNLEGKLNEVLRFEERASNFFQTCIADSFLIDEIHDIRVLIEDTFVGSPYEFHFENICRRVHKFENKRFA